MPLADFTIEVHEHAYGHRAVRVVVYEHVRALRAAASRYDNLSRSARRREHGGFRDTLGICHRFEWLEADSLESQPLCAIVRLARPHLGAGVVAHELTHAAVWIRELHVGEEAPLITDDDEEFCWLLGELVRQTVDAMYASGVYDD